MVNSPLLSIVDAQLYAQHVDREQRLVGSISDQYYFLDAYTHYSVNLLLAFPQTDTNEDLAIVLDCDLLWFYARVFNS